MKFILIDIVFFNTVFFLSFTIKIITLKNNPSLIHAFFVGAINHESIFHRGHDDFSIGAINQVFYIGAMFKH